MAAYRWFAKTNMKEIHALNESHIRDLHALYQKEWWTKGRSLEETSHCVQNSQMNIGIVDDQGALQAYARVLTDYTFKALIFDVIVSDKHRGEGLGERLISLIKNHEKLRKVKHFELYCLPEMFSFYEKYGFSSDVGDVRLMRLVNA